MGRRFSRWEYALLVLSPFGLLAVMWALTRGGIALAVPLLVLPLALGLVRRFWQEPPGPAFNALLARTAAFQVLFSALLCVAILLR
jgi:1,4-dihydroxy-2-naphthoate octaprenyltransferase